MRRTLFRFYFQTIFLSRQRQKLLLLALAGLFISSFALLVLQSAMGGLQNKLMERSKYVEGRAVLVGQSAAHSPELSKLLHLLSEYEVEAIPEYELEVLVQAGSYLSAAVVHGVDVAALPQFLIDKEASMDEAILPYELASRIGAGPSEQIRIISPAHTDFFLTEVPRSVSVRVERLIASDVPEVDAMHLWVRQASLFNLTRERTINRVRLYSDISSELKQKLQERFSDWKIQTWEQRHETLVWALGLETSVMVFLFTVMSLLVALCIVSGLFLFFDKIKWDLTGLWILGASKNRLEHSSGFSLMALSMSSCLLGIISAFVFLKLFSVFGLEILPAVFVDREIPIYITSTGLLTSFLVPCLISWIFSLWSLRQFHRSQDHLALIRSAC
ncbi:MAG: hypothetical protein CME71_01885 [Halobacteriovorax sp.]|nr:hypothetical protein [Halobacteriovorax sp.]